MIYCVEICVISPQTHLKPLLLLQKKILRIMTFSTYTEPIFKDLNVLTINKLVIHRIGIMMYKFNNGLLPTVLNSWYKKKMKFTNMTLEQNKLRISVGIQSFSSVSAKIWNAPMLHIDGNVPLVKFKQSLKLYLLNNTLVISYSK